MSSPTPGLMWSTTVTQGVLRIVRVTARHASLNDHFILTLNHIPKGGPFATVGAGLRLAEREWLPIGVTARLDH